MIFVIYTRLVSIRIPGDIQNLSAIAYLEISWVIFVIYTRLVSIRIPGDHWVIFVIYTRLVGIRMPGDSLGNICYYIYKTC